MNTLKQLFNYELIKIAITALIRYSLLGLTFKVLAISGLTFNVNIGLFSVGVLFVGLSILHTVLKLKGAITTSHTKRELREKIYTDLLTIPLLLVFARKAVAVGNTHFLVFAVFLILLTVAKQWIVTEIERLMEDLKPLLLTNEVLQNPFQLTAALKSTYDDHVRLDGIVYHVEANQSALDYKLDFKLKNIRKLFKK